MIISSSLVKILDKEDCVEINRGICLCNQGFQFQIWLDKNRREGVQVRVESDLSDYVTMYRVYDKRGTYEHPLNKKTDDYYIKSKDDMYPDLLKRIDTVTTTADEKCVLLIDVSEREKPVGSHTIKFFIGEETKEFTLEVLETKLVETDLILTNWFHLDGICNYYKVEPFSNDFYERFTWFLEAYVKMGNNMILVPAFTPPLDTEVGGERLTTQLVKISKIGEEYKFDFSEMKTYLEICASKGIKYFEHSHLFTQWGGEYCPKIIIGENGIEKNLFGWSIRSDDEKYKTFLKQYFTALNEFLEIENLKENFYLHLTDEPRPQHIEKYKRLSAFIKDISKGMKTMDALSEKEAAEAVDMPVVAMYSKDLPLFDENKMLYYCVEVDTDCITNRYFHMPLQRTEILGFQLYENQAKGFLHWGYNFYNTQLSKGQVDPYEDATAGGGFPAGDSFIVYPGEREVEPSIRYFSIKRAFEDYRLLKTVEAKVGKSMVMNLLEKEGVNGVHAYPKSVVWQENFRKKLYCFFEKE